MANNVVEKVDGRALRWVKHRENRTQHFMEITCDVVRKYGYQVSMDQIAEHAKTSKSILYRYFPDKVSLQYEVGNYVVQKLVDSIKTEMKQYQSPREMVKAAIDVYLDFMESDLDLYIFVRIGDLEGEPGSSKILDFDEILLGATAEFEADAAADQVLENNVGSIADSRTDDETFVSSHVASIALVSVIRNIAETWLYSRRILDRPEDYPDYNFHPGDRKLAELSRAEVTNLIFDCVDKGIIPGLR
ncbi:MAG: TetR/AcrR family transcriptional regulator [Arcanobacterium sp.]|nr:TetR/AcrR family transcriptional regulator [Arcanobacterium sp.]